MSIAAKLFLRNSNPYSPNPSLWAYHSCLFVSLWHAPLPYLPTQTDAFNFNLILATFLNPWSGSTHHSLLLPTHFFFRIHTFIFSYANSLVKKFSPPVISVKHLYYFKVNNKHCLPNNFFPSIQSTHALTLLITIAISLGFLTVFSSMTANTSHAGWFPIISARQPRPPVLPGNHLTGKKSTWLQHEQLETLQLLRPSQPCTVAEVSSQSHHNEAYYWE